MDLTYPFVICIGILVITLLIICKFNKKDQYKNVIWTKDNVNEIICKR